LDTTVCQPLLNTLQSGQEVSLTLCGDHHWRHYRLGQESMFNRLKQWLRPKTVSQEFKALASKGLQP